MFVVAVTVVVAVAIVVVAVVVAVVVVVTPVVIVVLADGIVLCWFVCSMKIASEGQHSMAVSCLFPCRRL